MRPAILNRPGTLTEQSTYASDHEESRQEVSRVDDRAQEGLS
jgi:hypothetical protein